MKSAQIAAEFLLIVGVAVLILSSFYIILTIQSGEIGASRELNELTQNTADIREELLVASSVNDGYVRSIYAEPNAYNENITYQIIDGFIIGKTSKYEVSFFVINASGTIVAGKNTIRKINGEIVVN